MPTLRFCTYIFYMFTPIDFIIYYHSQKLGMVNSVYLSPIYINVVDSVSHTRNLNASVHVFLICNERLLALNQSESFCI